MEVEASGNVSARAGAGFRLENLSVSAPRLGFMVEGLEGVGFWVWVWDLRCRFGASGCKPHLHEVLAGPWIGRDLGHEVSRRYYMNLFVPKP